MAQGCIAGASWAIIHNEGFSAGRHGRKRGAQVVTSEADTCREYVLPKLYEAGWSDDQIREQVTFTDGRIVVAGSRAARRGQKRADYVLRYGRDFPIAVVEAKAGYRHAADGLQ